MDAVEYVKQRKRMCDYYNNCSECPAVGYEECSCLNGIFKLVPIVEQWVKEHPVKTRQSEFLKMFPNAQKSLNGVLDICPRKFEPKKYKSATPDKVCVNGNADDEYHCDECCRDF